MLTYTLGLENQASKHEKEAEYDYNSKKIAFRYIIATYHVHNGFQSTKPKWDIDGINFLNITEQICQINLQV